MVKIMDVFIFGRSGNLMSCANWESFWLNEGFTVFFERETIREIFEEEIYQIECVNGIMINI